jgi:sugar transferase (PEP-CTERM/EpsH1 system associated)
MRILFVVPYVPNLVRVRPFNLIRHLAARGHRVTVATISTNEREEQDVRELSRHCTAVIAVSLPTWRSLANCVGALPTNEPLQARYSWSPDLMNRVNQLRADADVVHIEHLRGARYALASDSCVLGSLPVVWDSVDCISDLFEQAIAHRRDLGRLINRIELSRTRAYEASAVSRFDRILVTSASDQAALQALDHAARLAHVNTSSGRMVRGRDGSADRIAVLSNGVDLDYFAPGTDERQPDAIVFSGKLSYHANDVTVRHLLTNVMPLIWAARPDVKLVLVGKDPSSGLQRLARKWASRVVVTGTVPDMRPYLRRAAVAVAPLVYGVGCQNKVLEAMACGTPVVAASRAVAALTARPGRDLLVADGAQPFADAVLRLLGDVRLRHDLGAAGRAYVENHHQWDRIVARLETIYEEVLAVGGAHPLECAAG